MLATAEEKWNALNFGVGVTSGGWLNREGPGSTNKVGSLGCRGRRTCVLKVKCRGGKEARGSIGRGREGRSAW
jgi:hypothetical protein